MPDRVTALVNARGHLTKYQVNRNKRDLQATFSQSGLNHPAWSRFRAPNPIVNFCPPPVQGPQAGSEELSAKHASGKALFIEASREISRTPRRLPPCSDVSVLQKTRMSHFWDTHHT